MASPNAKITISLIDKTKKGFGSIGKSMKATRAAVNSTKGAVAGLAGAAGLGLLTKASFESIDATAKLADAVGISTEKLGGYQFLAGQAGVSSEALNNSFKKLANSVGEASMGFGTAAPAFRELGLSAQDLAKANPDEQFKRIAEAIGQVGDRSTQAAIAQDIFGKKGIDLLNVLDKGREGIEAYQREAELLGATFNRVDAAKVEAANDAFDKLKTIFTGFFNRVAVTLSPLIVGIAKDLQKVIIEAGGFQKAIDSAFRFAVRATGVFADGVRGIQIAFNLLKGVAAAVIGGISGSLGKFVGVIADISGNDGLKRASEAMKEFQSTAFDTFDTSTAKAKELTLSVLPSEVIKTKVAEYKTFANTIATENAKIAKSNTQAGGGGITDAAKKEQERIAAKFALLEAETMGELALNKQKLDAKLAQDLEFLTSAEALRVNGEANTNALVEGLRSDHAAKMLALEQKSVADILATQIDYSQSSVGLNAQLADRQANIDALSAAGKKQLAVTAFRDTLAIAATGSKKIFKINKQLALADAVINGFRAIQSGFATTPFFPVGIAMGALAAVKTAVQIKGIQSQTFAGGGSKPSASGGGSAAVPSVQSQQQQTPQSAPTVEGPAIRERKANIVVSGEIDTREKTLMFAKNLVELTKDGFTDLDIVLGAEV